jgi:hypothetical protein
MRKKEKGKRKIYKPREIEKERQRDQRDSDILRETERKKLNKGGKDPEEKTKMTRKKIGERRLSE